MVTNRLKWLLQLVLCCGLFVELCQSQGSVEFVLIVPLRAAVMLWKEGIPQIARNPRSNSQSAQEEVIVRCDGLCQVCGRLGFMLDGDF